MIYSSSKLEREPTTLFAVGIPSEWEIIMSSKMPPVPSQNQSQKGPGEHRTAEADDTQHGTHAAPNPDKQGQQGNSKVNTTHQGYQQDR